MNPRILIALAVYCFALVPLRAQGESANARGVPGIDADSERIMEVSLIDGSVLSSAMLVYPYRGRWVLPLGQLAEGLGLAINVSASLAGAEGFVIDEDRRFKLDTASCEVLANGKRRKYECEKVLPFNDDLYVLDELVEDWLPVSLEVSSLRSQVIITPRELLPEQARRNREREAARLRRQGNYDPGYPARPVPYGLFQLTALDQQLQATSIFPRADVPVVNSVTQLAGEMFGMESFGSINASERRVNGWRFSLARRSPDKPFLGPLRLRTAQFFDLDLPTVPLVSQAIPARGLYLSSFPVSAPLNFQTTDLQGPLAQGWEVLLFRNDILLDRRVGDSTGWYRFSDVPLQYGPNIFRLLFFGPHGERREETRNFIIDPAHLPRGERNFSLALGQVDATNHILSLQVAQSVSDGITALAGLSMEQEPARRHVTVGVITAFDPLLVTARGAFGILGGQAFELGAQTGTGRFSIGSKYTHLREFRSRLFNDTAGALKQTNQLESNVAYVLPVGHPIAVIAEHRRRTFNTGFDEDLLRGRLTTNLGQLQVQQLFDWLPDQAFVPLVGRTEVFLFPYRLRARAAVEYQPRQLLAAEGEVQFVPDDAFQVTAGLRRSFADSLTLGTFQLSRTFPQLSVGGLVTYGPGANTWTAGVQLAFSLVRDNRTGELHMQRAPQATLGAISLLAYLDANRNGVRDEGEDALPGVAFNVCQRESIETGALGVVTVTSVRPQTPCDISPGESKEPNPFLFPSVPGYRVVPRAGITARVDYPFVVNGQIDGYVNLRGDGGERPQRGVEVLLLDGSDRVVARTKTDRDGFYAFEAVPAGQSYRIRLTGERFATRQWVSSPQERHVSMAPQGAFESGQDFLVQPAAPPIIQ